MDIVNSMKMSRLRADLDNLIKIVEALPVGQKDTACGSIVDTTKMPEQRELSAPLAHSDDLAKRISDVENKLTHLIYVLMHFKDTGAALVDLVYGNGTGAVLGDRKMC